MNVSYNFVSLIALGNFNPAILSPSFLAEVCELDLGKLTDQSPSEIPVHKVLQFGNIRLTVSMDRLEILETAIQNTDETETVIGIFEKYYQQLPHTPLQAVGVNVNCDLLSEHGAEADVVKRRISQAQTYLDFLGVEEISVIENSIQTKSSKTWMSCRCVAKNVKGLTRIIDVTPKTDSILLNYNCEAGNLPKEKSNLKLLIDGRAEFCEEFIAFIKHLESD